MLDPLADDDRPPLVDWQDRQSRQESGPNGGRPAPARLFQIGVTNMEPKLLHLIECEGLSRRASDLLRLAKPAITLQPRLAIDGRLHRFHSLAGLFGGDR